MESVFGYEPFTKLSESLCSRVTFFRHSVNLRGHSERKTYPVARAERFEV